MSDIRDLPGEQMGASPVEGAPGRRPLLLRKGAFTKVLTAFSRKMETEIFHPAAERHMTYADALVFQARQYRRMVEGEVGEYSPLMLR